MNIGGSISGAVFSEDNRFRFALWRIWDVSLAMLLFVGLNSSTAEYIRNDPTIVRTVGFAKSGGFGGLFVGNLSPLVTPEPKKLYAEYSWKVPDALNDAALRQMRGLCGATLVGWGHFGSHAENRPDEVLALVGPPVYCLGKTKEGWPRHPLYVAADKPFEKYERGTI